MNGRWETVVVGAGPVGMMVALAAARRGSALLAGRRRPTPEPPRIDVVPASLLTLLLEFGVHPAALGVHALHDTRLVAWERAEPEIRRSPATAHIERSALDRALTAVIARTTAIETGTLSRLPPVCAGGLLVDATGRRAISARCRIRPPEAWVAKTFWLPGSYTRAAQAFRLAPLADGYTYRLGTDDCLMLGVIGVETLVRRPPDQLAQVLYHEGAGWVLAGLPALGDFHPGRGGVASIQWTEGDGDALRAGDAELARDALAAQGLATGISDALHIASALDRKTLLRRRQGQRDKHIATLLTTIARCHMRNHPAWSRYNQFLLASRPQSAPTSV